MPVQNYQSPFQKDNSKLTSFASSTLQLYFVVNAVTEYILCVTDLHSRISKWNSQIEI
jgi:hypothetical protein